MPHFVCRNIGESVIEYCNLLPLRRYVTEVRQHSVVFDLLRIVDLDNYVVIAYVVICNSVHRLRLKLYTNDYH